MDTFIYILLGLTSVIGLAFIVERGLVLRWSRVVPPAITRSLAACQTREDVKMLCRICEKKPSPLGRLLLLAAGEQHPSRSVTRRPSPAREGMCGLISWPGTEIVGRSGP